MKQDKPKNRMAFVILTSTIILAIGVIILMRIPIYYQEIRFGAGLMGVFELTLSDSEIVMISGKSQDAKYYMTHKANSKKLIDEKMGLDGFKFVEQLGATHSYARDGNTVLITEQNLWGRYVVWKIHYN